MMIVAGWWSWYRSMRLTLVSPFEVSRESSVMLPGGIWDASIVSGTTPGSWGELSTTTCRVSVTEQPALSTMPTDNRTKGRDCTA